MLVVGCLTVIAGCSSKPRDVRPRQPQRASGMKSASEALAWPGYRWRRQSTDHSDLYVLSGSRAETLAHELPRDAEVAVQEGLEFLGEKFSGPKLQLFVVGTDSEIAPLAGGLAFGEADPTHGVSFMVGNDSMTPPLRHEVMHLLSGRLWGPPALMWMAEGTGTLITRECGGQELGAIAAELSREGRLVPLDTLWHHFNNGWEAGAIYSIEAASLIDYIERVYGRSSSGRSGRPIEPTKSRGFSEFTSQLSSGSGAPRLRVRRRPRLGRRSFAGLP